MIVATLWWYLARSSGLVAAGLLVMSFLWGILLSTQLVKPVKRPAWLLDLHRWLAGLTVGFVALHLVALVADSYLQFDLRSLFVPFASEWKPGPVTWGIAGIYLLAAVQLTSWSAARSKLSRRAWHGIHLLSFPLVWVVAMHSGSAGTDAGNPVYRFTVLGVILIALFVIIYRILAGTGRNRPRAKSPAASPRRAGHARARS